MKTSHIIISTEYHANQPSIFAVIDGQYYGDMIYPKGREFPSVEYWNTATSSDSDRGFAVNEVGISEENVRLIKKLNNVIMANESMIIQSSFPYIPRTYKVRRGKAYAEYKAKYEKQQEEIKAESKANEPYYNAYITAYYALRNLLKSL